MKCFITSSSPDAQGHLRPGIPVQMSPFPHIAVGEAGRGRTLARMPVTLELATKNPAETDPSGGQVSLLTEAKVMRSSDGKTIVARAGTYPDQRCLVHLVYDPGFRGNCNWEVLEPATQNWYAIGWVKSGSDPVDIVLNNSLVIIIVSGNKAWGDAGRMGSSEEHLAILKPGAVIRFTRTGRTYGAPKVLLMMWDGENFSVETPDERLAREAQAALISNPAMFKPL
jgi:hypothetical protein